MHAANKPPLPMSDGGELLGHPLLFPVEFGPIGPFMDVFWHSPHLLRRLCPIFAARARITPHLLRRLRHLITACRSATSGMVPPFPGRRAISPRVTPVEPPPRSAAA